MSINEIMEQIEKTKQERDNLSQLSYEARSFINNNEDFFNAFNRQKKIQEDFLSDHRFFNQIEETSKLIARFNNFSYFENYNSFYFDALSKEMDPIKDFRRQLLPPTNDYLKNLGFQDSLNTIKSSMPFFFNYEDNYSIGYNNLYKNLNPNWSDIFLSKENPSDITIADTKKNKQFDAQNVKDVVGIPQLFKDITQLDVVDFLGYLEKFPLLAIKHPVGQKIFDELKEKITIHKKNINKTILYRSKIWKKNQTVPYTVNKMWKSPINYPTMGRFNPAGVSYAYFVDSIETSKSEVKISKNSKYNIMRTTLETEVSILDFSEQHCPIFEFCNKKQESNETTHVEYLIPNFIAQCIAYLKSQDEPYVDGIKYKSTLNPKGFCYVFFDLTEQNFKNSKVIK